MTTPMTKERLEEIRTEALTSAYPAMVADLLAEVDRARADVDRLTRERDEAERVAEQRGRWLTEMRGRLDGYVRAAEIAEGIADRQKWAAQSTLVALHSEKALREKAEADLAETAARLAAIDTGCWNCGGLPHTTECRVRDVKALLARAEKAEAERDALRLECHQANGNLFANLETQERRAEEAEAERDDLRLHAQAALRERDVALEVAGAHGWCAAREAKLREVLEARTQDHATVCKCLACAALATPEPKTETQHQPEVAHVDVPGGSGNDGGGAGRGAGGVDSAAGVLEVSEPKDEVPHE